MIATSSCAHSSSVFSGFDWRLPSGGPGAWVEAPPDPCRSGIHACRPADLPFCARGALYEIELDGAVVEEHMNVIAPRGGDEQSHANFINAYLKTNGAEPINLDKFRTLPSSKASGARRIGRLPLARHRRG